jgi:hypothetical protein
MTTVATAAASPAHWGLRILVGASVLAVVGAAVATALERGGSLVSIVYSLTTTSFLVVGLLISERRRGNVVGPLVLAFGLLITFYVVADAWIRYSGAGASVELAALVVSSIDGLYFLMIALLFLFFPDGHLPGRAWRALVGVTGVCASIITVGALLRPGQLAYYTWLANPLDPPANPFTQAWEIVYIATVVCVALAALSLVVRWRRAGPVERAQLKWVAAAAALVALAMLAYGAGTGPGRYSDVGDITVGAALGLFPLAIGIAVLRYRLYEIDRLISRTIAWALVTGVLVAVFAGTVVGLQALLQPFTDNSTLAVAASTLLAAALFQPLRARVQLAVDRRFNRARVDAQQAIDVFGVQLREEVDLGALRRRLLDTAATTVQPRGAAVWIRGHVR